MRKMILMKKNSGFTLLELMIVIAIIGITSAIAVPNFISWLPKNRMKSAARDIYSTIQSARIRAVKEGRRVVVDFNTGTGAAGTYNVFIDDGRGGGTPRDNTQNGAEPTIRSGQMPVDVNLYQANFGAGSWIRFDSRGRPNGVGGSARISNAGLNLFTGIFVRMTGTPDIRISTNGGTTFLDS